MTDTSEKEGKLLKILCIHGYRQNAQAFRERTGAFRKIIKKHAELVFIDAPNRVPALPSEDVDEGATGDYSGGTEQLGWWFSHVNDYYHAQDYTDCCKGFQESLDSIKKAFLEQGPFDGILAFSQGAALVSVICGMKEQDPNCPFQFDFAILVAGFKSRQSPHEKFYTIPITMPTLHVFGDTDKVIQKEMSENLLQYFVNPKIIQHPGGHFIPASGPQKKSYLEFLNAMLQRKNR